MTVRLIAGRLITKIIWFAHYSLEIAFELLYHIFTIITVARASLMPSENHWKYNSCSYSETTRGLLVKAVHVVHHSLIFISLIVDITIDRCSFVLSQSFVRALSYLPVSEVGNRRNSSNKLHLVCCLNFPCL